MCECFTLDIIKMRGCNISENCMHIIIKVGGFIYLNAIYMILKRELVYV